MECLMSHPAPHRRLSAHLPLRIIATETTASPQIEYHVVNCESGLWGNKQNLAWWWLKSTQTHSSKLVSAYFFMFSFNSWENAEAQQHAGINLSSAQHPLGHSYHSPAIMCDLTLILIGDFHQYAVLNSPIYCTECHFHHHPLQDHPPGQDYTLDPSRKW